MLRRDPLAYPEPLIRKVYAYVAYRIGDGPDAEDVTSATFERAIRYRRSYTREKGEPLAWLIGIARNEIAEHLAGRDRTTGELPDAAAPGDLATDAAQRLDVVAAVAQLEARDRELLALRYGADLSAPQIAELVEERVNTVEVALHRALKRLREIVEPDRPTSALAPALRPDAERPEAV